MKFVPSTCGRRLRRVLLLLLLPLLTAAGALLWQWPQIMLAAEAYLYGYPLVIMDVTRTSAQLAIGPQNQLRRVRQFPDASFHDVVRPNVDTLYTTAFIDMDAGPWVFQMAPNEQRYELMAFLDGWTNVYAAPGTRTSGSAGGQFLLAGPNWQGSLPAGLTLLRAPTRIVWLIGRTQTNGAADYALVHRLQDGVLLRTLAAWQAGQPESVAAWQAAPVRPLAATAQMQAMTTDAFFTRLTALMVENPPPAADAPLLAQLAAVGIHAGQPPQWNVLQRGRAALGRALAERGVAAQLRQPRALVRGWATPPATLGAYGTDYHTRAAVAMVGLGANLPADATYPNTRIDADGQPLDGSRRYRLHFKAGALPPATAFWSVTAYGADDFFIDNALQRYAIGDRDPLVRNADGSLDLLVQATAPAGAMAANWLPVRAGAPFLLNARLYWPKPAALDARWGMPAVERLP